MQDFGMFVWKYPTHVGPGRWNDLVSIVAKKTLRETAPRIKRLGAVWDSTYRTQFREYQDVFLICHSMGGLVVKSWIIDLLEGGQSERLKALRHIAFYATPHNGAPVTHGLRNEPHSMEIEGVFNFHLLWLKDRPVSEGIPYSMRSFSFKTSKIKWSTGELCSRSAYRSQRTSSISAAARIAPENSAV